MGPRLTVSPVEASDGTRPRYPISSRGVGNRDRSPISARNAVAEMKSIPRSAIRAVTTSANGQSETATRIACSSRSMRSCAWRIASSISSKAMRCSAYSSFWLINQFLCALVHALPAG
jgi:hypothetical protein